MEELGKQQKNEWSQEWKRSGGRKSRLVLVVKCVWRSVEGICAFPPLATTQTLTSEQVCVVEYTWSGEI